VRDHARQLFEFAGREAERFADVARGGATEEDDDIEAMLDLAG